MKKVFNFKLLHPNDACIGQRTLHRAAESAAICDAVEKPGTTAMLSSLIEETKMDVNKMDTTAESLGDAGHI